MISLQILWATILVNNLLTSAAVAKVYALYLSVLYFVVFLKFYLVLDLSSFFFFLRHKMEKLRSSTQRSLGPQQHDN